MSGWDRPDHADPIVIVVLVADVAVPRHRLRSISWSAVPYVVFHVSRLPYKACYDIFLIIVELRLQRIDRLVRIDVVLHSCLATVWRSSWRQLGS